MAGEDCTSTTRGMFLVTTNSVSPFATGRWTESQMGTTKSDDEPDVHRPFKKSDPQVQHLDDWGKLEGGFNNVFNPNGGMMTPIGLTGEDGGPQWDDVFNDLVETTTKRAPIMRKPLKKKTQFEIAYADETDRRQPEEEAIEKQNLADIYNKLFGRGTTTIQPEVLLT